MKFAKLNTLACAAVLALCASQASAIGVFTINPNAIPGNAFAISPFQATSLSGNTSELLHLSGNNATASGWAQFSSFSNGATQIGSLVTGLGGVDYGLYLTFQLADTLVSGTAGALNSIYSLTQLDFQVWADKDLNTTFTLADASTALEATVNGTKTDDIFLAAGSLQGGVAGFDSFGGAYINAINSFAVCTGVGTATVGSMAISLPDCASGTGANYFAAPVPFFDLAFSAFNNTAQGIKRNAAGNLISITNAVGIVDFNHRIPEPASLALVGLSLLALGGASALRKHKAG